MPDPRPLFHRTLDQTGEVVREVRPDQLAGPTPCAEYDVRTLLGHILSVLRRVTHVAGGGAPMDIPQVSTGVAHDGWYDAYVSARAELNAAWAEDPVLDQMMTLPFGTMPGRAAVTAYTVEVTMHGWDLAAATGQTELLDEKLGSAALELAQSFIPAQPRGGRVPFGPVVPVPEDAGPYRRLAGWLGRAPADSEPNA